MARNYAALPHEYLEEWEGLTDAEVGRLVIALLKYSATGEIAELGGNERYLFPRVRAQEDRFRASYAETSVKRREAGRKGAEKRWHGDKGGGDMAEDSKAITNDSKAITSDDKNAYTETETKTETETETISPLLPQGESARARAGEAAAAAAVKSERESSEGPSEAGEALAAVLAFYRENISRVRPSAVMTEQLRDYTLRQGPELVIHAMKRAAEADKGGWLYARSILDRYAEQGLATMEDVRDDEARFRGRKGRGKPAPAEGADDEETLAQLSRIRENMRKKDKEVGRAVMGRLDMLLASMGAEEDGQ